MGAIANGSFSEDSGQFSKVFGTKRYLWYFNREKTSPNIVSTLVISLIDSGFSNIDSCERACVRV